MRFVLIVSALCLASAGVFAQPRPVPQETPVRQQVQQQSPPSRPSSVVAFSTELARNLAMALAENDALSARVAALTAEIESLRKPADEK